MPRVFPYLVMMVLASACARGSSPSLAIGSPAPDFTLPGIDGSQHSLRDYAASQVLAIVFTCNSCPASQKMEARLAAMDRDYRPRGVALVAINPNDSKQMSFDQLSHTDVGESLDDMRARAAFRHLAYPYLSDGGTQALARQFGVAVTPQIFVFDKSRILRYRGRIDDPARPVASDNARNAIDALLAGRPVATVSTTPVGCPLTPRSIADRSDATQAAGAAEPVSVETVGADGLKKLRQNGTGKLLLVNFWATWCAPCAIEFPDLEDTYRMYRRRDFDFVAVSVNDPQERPAVIEFLQKHHASHRNLQFATPDTYDLQAAFDPKLPAPVPFTLLLAPNGDVLYQELGASDIPRLRRAILANLPEDPMSAGQRAYWSQRSP